MRLSLARVQSCMIRDRAPHVTAPLEGEDIPNPNEASLVELEDGRLMMNIRNESEHMLRAVSISEDGGNTFSPMTLAPNLPDPICQGAICRKEGEVLFTNCNSQNEKERDHLTIRRLDTEGRILESLEISPTGGYSDLCYSTRTGKAYVLYECENSLYMRLAEVSFDQ